MQRYEMLLSADQAHKEQVMYDDQGCKFWSSELDTNFVHRFERCAEQHLKAVVVIGDSHGMDLYNAIAMNANYDFVVSLSKSACRAHALIEGNTPTNINHNAKPACPYEDFKEFALTHSDNILTVIYTQTPDRLFKRYIDNALPSDLSMSHLDQVVDYLRSLKNLSAFNVLMVGMLPPMVKSPIQLDHRQDIEEQLQDNFSYNAISLTKLTDKIFSEKLNKREIPYVSKFEGFDLNIPDDLISNGHLTYSDRRHLSYEGEKVFGQRLVALLNL